MQISDTELKKVLAMGGFALIESEEGFEPSPRAGDEPLIKQLTQEIMVMPDREDRVVELKARIDAGAYQVSGEEIADAIVRRAIADRVK